MLNQYLFYYTVKQCYANIYFLNSKTMLRQYSFY